MNFGYPGENVHLENHGVSEESFWPSFTDIMMVIVMVFLLVTVAVILNNWSLIADLKNSIQAQKIASSLAENRQEKNVTLESKLSSLEKQLVILNAKYKAEEKELSGARKQLSQKETALLSVEKHLNELTQEFDNKVILLTNTKKQLSESNQDNEEKITKIASLQASIASITTLKKELEALTIEQKNKLAEAQKNYDTLKQTLTVREKTVATLETNKKNNESQIIRLKDDITKLNASIKDKGSKISQLEQDVSNLTQEKTQLISQNTTQKNTIDEHIKTQQQLKNEELLRTKQALEAAEAEKQRIILAMNEKITESEKQRELLASKLADANQQVVDLEKWGESQLLSLQGEYDSLDAKYQKLVRPARSAKGKFVVSVTYRKRGNKKLVRIKPSPSASYHSVNQKELHKILSKLKSKYQDDLYLKIIIPDNSGLSYNEAWKFTNDLQKKYDYYQ